MSLAWGLSDGGSVFDVEKIAKRCDLARCRSVLAARQWQRSGTTVGWRVFLSISATRLVVLWVRNREHVVWLFLFSCASERSASFVVVVVVLVL
jgi:hypothetical protein